MKILTRILNLPYSITHTINFAKHSMGIKLTSSLTQSLIEVQTSMNKQTNQHAHEHTFSYFEQVLEFIRPMNSDMSVNYSFSHVLK